MLVVAGQPLEGSGSHPFLQDPQPHSRTSSLGPDSVTVPLDQPLSPGDRRSDGLDHIAIHGTGQPGPDHLTGGSQGLGEDNWGPITRSWGVGAGWSCGRHVRIGWEGRALSGDVLVLRLPVAEPASEPAF